MDWKSLAIRTYQAFNGHGSLNLCMIEISAAIRKDKFLNLSTEEIIRQSAGKVDAIRNIRAVNNCNLSKALDLYERHV